MAWALTKDADLCDGPVQAKSIQSGCEASTHSCMPAAAPLVAEVQLAIGVTTRPRMSPLCRGPHGGTRPRNSLRSTRASSRRAGRVAPACRGRTW